MVVRSNTDDEQKSKNRSDVAVATHVTVWEPEDKCISDQVVQTVKPRVSQVGQDHGPERLGRFGVAAPAAAEPAVISLILWAVAGQP